MEIISKIGKRILKLFSISLGQIGEWDPIAMIMKLCVDSHHYIYLISKHFALLNIVVYILQSDFSI